LGLHGQTPGDPEELAMIAERLRKRVSIMQNKLDSAT